MVSTGRYDFNFPSVTKTNGTEGQEQKIREEFLEFYYFESDNKDDKIMEALDLIHAVETWLRMECTEEEVANAYQKVFVKNALRGYYDVEKAVRDKAIKELIWNNDDDDDEEYAGYYKHHGNLSTSDKQSMIGEAIKPYVDSYQLHAIMTMVKYVDRMGEKPGEEAERAAYKAADYAYKAMTGQWLNEVEG